MKKINLSKKEYLYQKDFLEKHQKADEVIYDQESEMPVIVVYRNPIFSAYAEQQETLKAIGFAMRSATYDDEYEMEGETLPPKGSN